MNRRLTSVTIASGSALSYGHAVGRVYDAIVVGTGYGGVSANESAEAAAQPLGACALAGDPAQRVVNTPPGANGQRSDAEGP